MPQATEYDGIKLPLSIVTEVEKYDTAYAGGAGDSLLNLNRTSRKKRRKQERDEKKAKRSRVHPQRAQRDMQPSSKPKQIPGVEEKKVKNMEFQLEKDSSEGEEEEEEEFEGFGDDDFSGMESDDDLEADSVEDMGVEDMGVNDTWAALKALKEKKLTAKGGSKKAGSKEKVVPIAKEHASAVEDTYRALAEAKKKKIAKEVDGSKVKEVKEKKGKNKIKDETTSEKREYRKLTREEERLLRKDREDMEYYARKLGLKSLLLPKSEIDDGLGDLLGDLDFDQFDYYGRSKADNAKDVQDNEKELSDFFDMASEGEEDSFDEESENEVPKQKENPFIAPAAAPSAPQKYMPPSKRKLMNETNSESESEELQRLKRLVKGHMNKLTEANVGMIINEVEKLYVSHPRSQVTSVVSDIIIESTTVQGALSEGFLILHAAFATALFRTVGMEFGAHFVQTLVESFDRYHRSESKSKEAANLLSLLSEIYSFQLISCRLVYDFIKEFLTELTEASVEYLLRIIRNAGPQLRSDDASALKDIIILLQGLVSRTDASKITARTKFLVETVTDLKNNKLKRGLNESAIASSLRMKKFLGSVQGVSKDPIHVSLEDIRNSETKGKWWIVGAAWKGNEGKNLEDHDKAAVKDILDAAEPNWVELARQQRMNTDVRRAIFVALMSSDDYVDACERLRRLALKNKQEREIPRIILHCCGSEEVYNPYYALVAGQLCRQRSLKKTFQFLLWDYLDQIDNNGERQEGLGDKDQLRKTMHFAQLYAAIVVSGEIALDVLKTVNFIACSSELSLFLELFFINVFQSLGKRAEKGHKQTGGLKAEWDASEVTKLITSTKTPAVLKGTEYFLDNVKKSSFLTSKKQKNRVLWALNWASTLLSEITSNIEI